MNSVVTRTSRVGLDIFFLYVGLVTIVNGLIVTRSLRGWILGDWLINYQGGFVRRGLPGEVALLLARLFHTTPVFFVVLCYLTLYGVFFLAIRSLVRKTSVNFWLLALVLSPATLSFQILHRGSGFRKEVIYLAAFTWFVALLRKAPVSSFFVATYLSCVLILSTLSHEGLIFYSPYFVGSLLISGRGLTQALKDCLVPLLCGAIIVVACVDHPGNTAIANSICTSIGYKLQSVAGSTEICANGAIPYLTKTRAVAADEALNKIVDYRYLRIFPWYLLLALLPAIGATILLARTHMMREIKILWTTSAISFMGTLVLFRYAVDWGRWIYIHAVSITVLLLFIDSKRMHAEPEETLRVREPRAPRRMVQWAFVFIYATFWILPSDTEILRMGYAGRVLDMLHLRSEPSAGTERTPLHVREANP